MYISHPHSTTSIQRIVIIFQFQDVAILSGNYFIAYV